MADPPAALTLEDFAIELSPRRVLPNLPLSLSAEAGEMVALSGPIGSGKTLLLHGLGGLLPPPLRTQGRAHSGGGTLPLALVPQDPRWAVLPSDTIASLVKEAKRETERPAAPVETFFPELFLSLRRLQHLPFHALSASEKIRVLLCLGLASSAAILVYDGLGETLSPVEERRALDLLRGAARAGRIVLVGTRFKGSELPPDFRPLDLSPSQSLPSPLPLMRRSARSERPPGDGTATRSPALELRHVSALVLPAGPNPVRFLGVRNVSLSVRPGGALGILGPSGSGKTILLETILGLRSQRVGSIMHLGTTLAKRAEARPHTHRKALQLVLENPRATFNRSTTVRTELDRFSRRAKTSEEDPESWLERLRLPSRLLDLTPSALSEGEIARLALARCLALSPDVLLLDEPRRLDLTGDDAALLAVLQAERDRGMALVFTTSDPSTASLLADQLAIVHAGMITEIGPVESVLGHPAHPISEEVLSGPRPLALDPAENHAGCPWVETCHARVLPHCQTKAPALKRYPSAGLSRRVACHYPLGSRTEPVGDAPVPPMVGEPPPL